MLISPSCYLLPSAEKQWPRSFALKANPMHLRSSNGCRVRATLGADKSIKIPHQWYNLIADLPVKPPPPLHPKTYEPIKPEDLSPLFPDELIKQEVTTDRFIDIPDEVRDIYSLWRPTPLIRFDLDAICVFLFLLELWSEESHISLVNLEPRGWKSF